MIVATASLTIYESGSVASYVVAPEPIKKKKGPSDPHSFSIRNEIGRPADDERRPPMGIAGRQTSISASSLSLLFRRPFCF